MREMNLILEMRKCIDQQIDAIYVEGKVPILIQMTEGAERLLNEFEGVMVTGTSSLGMVYETGSMTQYHGIPVEIASLDVPAIVYGRHIGEVRDS